MNGAIVSRLNGSVGTGGGNIIWTNATEDTLDHITCNHGMYWLLATIKVLDLAELSDEELFEWSAVMLTPKSKKLTTRVHTHYATIAGDISHSSDGPRAIFNNPFQLWSFGTLSQGQELRLNASLACEVELISIRQAAWGGAISLGVELR